MRPPLVPLTPTEGGPSIPGMTALGDLDRQRIRALHDRELDRFRDARPATLAMLERARSCMPNGTPMTWMASDYVQPVYV
jgi:hypothetical protein